jgi:hypothetical protein
MLDTSFLYLYNKNGGRDFSLPPSRLYPINQFAIHNLHSPITDVIHSADPLHLVASLELLRDTFCLCYLHNQPKKHFLCLPVNICQIIVQPAGQQQRGISTVLMLTKIPTVALSPNANRFAVRHGQAGEPILPALLVPQAVFRIKPEGFIDIVLIEGTDFSV